MFTRATVSTVILIAAALCTAATSASAAEEPLPVFILAGQSNMNGGGKGKQLPPDLAAESKNVLRFNATKKTWTPQKPGSRFGPEVTFGREMAKALGRPVGLIKFAVSGSHLVYDWNAAIPKAKKNYYAQLIEMLDKAKASRPIEIFGMVWMQGERDARYPGAAKKYAANLDVLVKTARKDAGAPKMTFVLGRVNPNPKVYKFVEAVRKAQAGLKLPRTAWVNCDDLGMWPDKVHLNTQGQIELGKRFAKATLKLLKTPAAKQD